MTPMLLLLPEPELEESVAHKKENSEIKRRGEWGGGGGEGEAGVEQRKTRGRKGPKRPQRSFLSLLYKGLLKRLRGDRVGE